MNKQDRIKAYNNIKNEDELMDYMNNYIKYGWITIDNEIKDNTLSEIHTKYKVNSLDLMFESGYGTCIEQAKLIQNYFLKKGYEVNIYCTRLEDLSKEIILHCFVIANKDDNYIYFEHSNPTWRDIYYFNDGEEAYEYARTRCNKYKQRKVTKLKEIPDGLTFDEFVDYVDSLDNSRSRG